jgi:O-antigen/teichoic acid export membrane protein
VHRFESLAASLVVEGLLRVLVAGSFVRAGLGSAGALLGNLGAQAGAAIPALLQFRHMRRHRPHKAADDGPLPLPGRPGELWMDAVALALFSLLCFLDALVVKHHFDDARASLYSRAALVAKSFLYLASALNMVLLPMVAAQRARRHDARGTLWRFMGLTLLAELAGLAVVWAFTPWVIRLLCGADPAFQALAPLVRVFALAVVPLALLQLALYYHLALGSRRLLQAMALAVPAYAALLQWWAADERAVVALLGGFSLGLLVIALLGVPGRPSPETALERQPLSL